MFLVSFIAQPNVIWIEKSAYKMTYALKTRTSIIQPSDAEVVAISRSSEQERTNQTIIIRALSNTAVIGTSREALKNRVLSVRGFASASFVT
jgi:hypothetical protein